MTNAARNLREVGDQIILPRFRALKDGDISYKTGDDPVTIADKEAESALSERLIRLLPGSKTVGEEAFFANPAILDHFSGESPVWVIDPIDGTRNFVGGTGLFGIIVALVKQNHTVAGWLYHPVSGDGVVAERGGGAWFKGQRLTVLPPEPLERLTGWFGDRITKKLEESAQRSGPPYHPQFEHSRFSACHEYVRLVLSAPAMGLTRPQWHFRSIAQTSTPWDDLAGMLIHAEAGGYGAYWNGAALTPGSTYDRGFLLAPDKDSWHALREWVGRYYDLPDLKKCA